MSRAQDTKGEPRADLRLGQALGTALQTLLETPCVACCGDWIHVPAGSGSRLLFTHAQEAAGYGSGLESCRVPCSCFTVAHGGHLGNSPAGGGALRLPPFLPFFLPFN